MGKLEQGAAELEWFVARRPDDAVGHYELAEVGMTPEQRCADYRARVEGAVRITPTMPPRN
jgi:hypothetical protein